MPSFRRSTAIALVFAVPLLAACGSDNDAGDASSSPGSSSGQAIDVVASTNVWGNIVEQVGGGHVDVTSIISDPSQDPHSYEANAGTLLAVSQADLIVENGGGYDDFVDTLVESAGTHADVLNAVEVSGAKAEPGEELNEHVWYDFAAVQAVAAAVADDLSSLDPDNAEEFNDNATAFTTKLDALTAREKSISKVDSGKAIAITEPVPLYMTEACGLTNATPSEFSEAIEEGDDVSPAVLEETLALFSSHSVDALVYNQQTSGPITEKIRTAAEDAGVAVVPVTETLPEGSDYLSWMSGNLDAIESALGGS